MQIDDHFGNGLIRTRDPENLGIDIIFTLLSHTISEQGPKKWNFSNGGPNLHITQNAQGCQGDTIQIIDQQKNIVMTPYQGSPKNQGFTAGLVAKETPNLHTYAYANCLIISAMA